uniref:Uncharacterized protein n=1 Tax=Alexandrium andersonii TaxID=327968 RepID=A0A7S2IQ65_9DINO
MAYPTPPAMRRTAGQTESLPREKRMHYLVPDARTFCVQGPKDYLSRVLRRTKLLSAGYNFKQTTVTEGTCESAGFAKKSPKKCFGNRSAGIYTDEKKVGKTTETGTVLSSIKSFGDKGPSVNKLLELLDDMTSGAYAFGMCRAAEHIG